VRRLVPVFFGAVVCLTLAGEITGQQQMPAAWPYGLPQLPPGVVPPQAAMPRLPAPTNPNTPPANGQPPVLRQAKGSRFQFTQQQVNNSYGPADWFPEDHPTMPPVVSTGKPGVARACALCHLTTGRGRPENAPVHGLSSDYIVQQLRDFQQGLRRSADPRKANTLEMAALAKTLSDEEITQAAAYFSSIKIQKYVRVVESDTVPTLRIQGEIYFAADEGKTTEPIGVRVIEMPEDATETQLRNPRSGFVAYAPVGSIKRGEALATTGGNGRTLACTTCHGPDMKGVGPVPTLAGRSPSYLARQIYDMKLGTRKGPLSVLMKPVVEKLTDADIVDLVAFISSREPG
jgi:cytochrome c553